MTDNKLHIPSHFQGVDNSFKAEAVLREDEVRYSSCKIFQTKFGRSSYGSRTGGIRSTPALFSPGNREGWSATSLPWQDAVAVSTLSKF